MRTGNAMPIFIGNVTINNSGTVTINGYKGSLIKDVLLAVLLSLLLLAAITAKMTGGPRRSTREHRQNPRYFNESMLDEMEVGPSDQLLGQNHPRPPQESPGSFQPTPGRRTRNTNRQRQQAALGEDRQAVNVGGSRRRRGRGRGRGRGRAGSRGRARQTVVARSLNDILQAVAAMDISTVVASQLETLNAVAAIIEEDGILEELTSEHQEYLEEIDLHQLELEVDMFHQQQAQEMHLSQPSGGLEAGFVDAHCCGRMDSSCEYCAALRWADEKKSICCSGGQALALKDRFTTKPPEPLWSLMTTYPATLEGRLFKDNIRKMNNTMSMASSGMVAAHPPAGITMLATRGSVHHFIGPALPAPGAPRQFAQLYIIDNAEEQLQARVGGGLVQFSPQERDLLARMQAIINLHNPYARQFRQLCEVPQDEVALCDIVFNDEGKLDRRRYNIPTTAEVAFPSQHCLPQTPGTNCKPPYR